MDKDLKKIDSVDNRDDAKQNEKPLSVKKQPGFFEELFKLTIFAVLIVLPIRIFIAQPFIVSGASMDPTFESGQYLIVDQLSYYFEKPQRGEIIIFRFPKDKSKFFIKRIIGLPGETINLSGKTINISSEDGRIVLDEPYVSPSNLTDSFIKIKLDEGEYFVLGDNRASSSDSRVWGALHEDLIIGRAIVRLLPIGKVGLFPGFSDYGLTSN